jgi:hypothetical protein
VLNGVVFKDFSLRSVFTANSRLAKVVSVEFAAGCSRAQCCAKQQNRR